MFRKNTLFVVGAGASFEVGMPTGGDLKKIISSKLSIQFQEIYKLSSGCPLVSDAIKYLAGQAEHNKNFMYSEYLRACRQISASMPQSSSIDNFIDAHRDDSSIGICGKLGIAASIIEAESKSKLMIKGASDQIIFKNIEETWYMDFWKIMSEGVARSEIDNIFDNVSVITFNYDRNIEHFIFNSIIKYYAIPRDEAAKLMGNLKIIHPYGTIGRLPWQEAEGVAYDYGQSANHKDIIDSAQRLRTFTERNDDADSLARIKETVRSAETVIFLGFSYNIQNMTLLHSKISPDGNVGKRIYGTALGIDDNDCAEIEDLLLGFLPNEHRLLRSNVKIVNKFTCHEFMASFSRSLGEFSL